MKTNKTAPRFQTLDDADLDRVSGGFGGVFNPMDGFKSWYMGSTSFVGSNRAPTGDGGSTNWGNDQSSSSSSGFDAMGNSTGGNWGDSGGGWGGGGDSSGGGSGSEIGRAHV